MGFINIASITLLSAWVFSSFDYAQDKSFASAQDVVEESAVEELPDLETLAAKVKEHLATDEERQSGYVFVERRTEQKLNGAGRVTSETVKVYEVYPGLEGEERYRRLIEEDGKPLPPQDLAKQDEKRRQEIDEYRRNTASASGREKHARDVERQRQRYSAAIDDLFRVYDIRIVGRERINGHDTILAALTPNGVKPRTDDGKIMTHFNARAWISESDYELVRVEVEAIRDLTFGLGLLGRVHKGTVASFERKKVNGEVWLPAKVTWTGSGRMLLVRRLRIRGVSEFSNYRKFSVDTNWQLSE